MKFWIDTDALGSKQALKKIIILFLKINYLLYKYLAIV